MKAHLLGFVKRVIEFLQKTYDKYHTVIEDETLPYEPLSPTGNAEEVEVYSKALYWAIKNRKKYDIKNIALTGPYGSGKSSILKTFIESNKDESLHFMQISLATFKEEELPTVAISTSTENYINSNADKLRLIELSILQQIFYRVDDKKIPDSRFKKIHSYTKAEIQLKTIGLSLFLISLLYLSYPELIQTLISVTPTGQWSKIAKWISLCIVILIGIPILYKSIRLLGAIRINKVNIHNAEIDISDKISKSILNHHLDEILYFFYRTPYNVVIIEDLDRFKQTEIFTKLRELNLLINQSDKIKKEVVFVYAVRDDMFIEETDRTKFFDFIIPVIPVINPSNSSDKLLNKISSNQYQISVDLIDSIARFIDDMRLLHNIVNEFYLYREKLDKGLAPNKLLAIIVYKNLFPKDFTDLTYNKGQIFNALNQKQGYINQLTEKLRQEINDYKAKIEQIESASLMDIMEIRKSYLLHMIEGLQPFYSFYANDGIKSFQQMTEEGNFNLLMTNEIQYYHQNPAAYGNTPRKFNIDFAALEKKVNPKRSYNERNQQIKDYHNNQQEQLKRKIQEKEIEINQLRHLKISQLLEKANFKIELNNEKQTLLTNVLLRNEFIDEDYLDYISIFYPGNISREDNQFLMNVKTNIDTNYDRKLQKVENLIKKINITHFSNRFVFNYDLMDFLLSNRNYKAETDFLLAKLSDQSEESIRFMDGFIENGKNVPVFIQQLLKKWNSLWEYINEKSKYTEEKKFDYFKLLIQFGDINDLEKLYQAKSFKGYLLDRPDFLTSATDIPRIKEIIKKLKIKFTELEGKASLDELLDFIYEGNYYALNPYMLKLMLRHKQAPSLAEFETKNYHCITHSKCDLLIKYVNDNLVEYLSNVYIELENNRLEPEVELLNLLNNGELELEDKEMIIQHVATRISDLTKVNDVETKTILIKENRVTPVWENLIDFYRADGSKGTTSLVSFLEEKENFIALSAKKIPKGEEVKENSHENEEFIVSLIKLEQLSDSAYEQIASAFPFWYTSLDFSELSFNKVRTLIKTQTIRLNQQTFDQLKVSFSSLVITLLEKQKATLLQDPTAYILDPFDIVALLKSELFSGNEKNLIVEKSNENLLVSSGEILELIGIEILKDKSFHVTDSVLRAILLNQNLNIEQRIRIFNLKHAQLSDEQLPPFFDSLDTPYADISIKGKRPLLPKTDYNAQFAQIIVNRKYVSSADDKENGIRINTYSKE